MADMFESDSDHPTRNLQEIYELLNRHDPARNGGKSILEQNLEEFLQHYEATEKYTHMKEFFQALVDHAEEANWERVTTSETARTLVARFPMNNATLTAEISLMTEKEAVHLSVQLPIAILPDFQPLLAMEISQMNQMVCYGNFCLDADDKQVLYNYTYSVADADFDEDIFDAYLQACLLSSDVFYPRIARFATGALTESERTLVKRKLERLQNAL